jgi:hypothetical protein
LTFWLVQNEIWIWFVGADVAPIEEEIATVAHFQNIFQELLGNNLIRINIFLHQRDGGTRDSCNRFH